MLFGSAFGQINNGRPYNTSDLSWECLAEILMRYGDGLEVVVLECVDRTLLLCGSARVRRK